MRNRACHEAERTDQVEPIPQVHFCPTAFSCTERCRWMASSVIINRTQYNAAVGIARPKAGVTATGNVALQVAGFTQSLIRRPVITPITNGPSGVLPISAARSRPGQGVGHDGVHQRRPRPGGILRACRRDGRRGW